MQPSGRVQPQVQQVGTEEKAKHLGSRPSSEEGAVTNISEATAAIGQLARASQEEGLQEHRLQTLRDDLVNNIAEDMYMAYTDHCSNCRKLEVD